MTTDTKIPNKILVLTHHKIKMKIPLLMKMVLNETHFRYIKWSNGRILAPMTIERNTSLIHHQLLILKNALKTRTKYILFEKDNKCCFDLFIQLFLFWVSFIYVSGTKFKRYKGLFTEYIPTFLPQQSNPFQDTATLTGFWLPFQRYSRCTQINTYI